MFSIPKPYRNISLAVSGVVLVLALLFVWHMTSDSDSPPEVYYYDLNTGKLFARTYVPDLPIAAPSGPTPEG